MKNHDFRPICRFISKMIHDRATVTVEGDKKLYPSFQVVLVSMTFSDFGGRRMAEWLASPDWVPEAERS